MVSIKAQPIVFQVSQTLYQQACADQQHDGQADFSDNQQLSRQPVASRPARAAAGFAQPFVQVSLGNTQGRRQAEKNARENRGAH